MGTAELEPLGTRMRAAVSLARVPSEQSVLRRARAAAQPVGSVAQDSVGWRRSCLLCTWKKHLRTGVLSKAVSISVPLINAFTQTPEFTC